MLTGERSAAFTHLPLPIYGFTCSTFCKLTFGLNQRQQRLRRTGSNLSKMALPVPLLILGGDEEDTKDRTKQKACLERYRKACNEILGVLHRTAPDVRIQCLVYISHLVCLVDMLPEHVRH
jgi:hypothetical protein